MLAEVNELKLSNSSESATSEEFIINELNYRSIRASSLITNNVNNYDLPEPTAGNTVDKIRHDDISVFNVIGSIVCDSTIKPLKLIRLGTKLT